MAIQDATFTGIPQILGAYDRQECGCFSVWCGTDLMFSHIGEDITLAREKLHENLIALEQAENRNLFKIKFHPEVPGTFITNKTPVTGTMYVRVFEWFPGGINPQGQIIPHRLNYGNKSMQDEIDELRSKIAAMEADDDGSEEDNGKMNGIGKLIHDTNTLLSNPNVMGLIEMWTGKKINSAPGAVSLSGISSDEKLQKALQALKENDDQLEDDLLILAQLSQQNPKQFQMLIGMLRKMK